MLAKSKKFNIENDKPLRLTRAITLENVFDRNYDHIWHDILNPNKVGPEKLSNPTKKPAWNQNMSDALAEHNNEIQGQLNTDGMSSIILDRLSRVDLDKARKTLFSGQLLFIDDLEGIISEDGEVSVEVPVEESDDHDDSLAPPSDFGVSRAESQKMIKGITRWHHADQEAFDGLQIPLTSFEFLFTGELYSSPIQTAPVAANNDPNDDILDAAAWGLTEEIPEETQPEQPTQPQSQTNDLNVANNEVMPQQQTSANTSAMDIAPAQEIASVQNIMPTNSATPSSQQETSSSDIVSIDNLLKNIGYQNDKTQDENSNAPPNQDTVESLSIENPPTENSQAPIMADELLENTKQQQRQQIEAQKKAQKAQRNAEKQARNDAKLTQKNAHDAEKKLAKQAKLEQKQALKAEKLKNKNKTTHDVLAQNAMPMVQSDGLPPEPSMIEANHAETILQNLNQPNDDATDDGIKQDDNFPHDTQIQQMIADNPLPPVSIDIPQNPEHRQIASDEIKNLLGINPASDTNAPPPDISSPNISSPDISGEETQSSESILNAFKDLQHKMAEKLHKKS